MKVLLTGATGFIGKHTMEALLAAGHEVVALHRNDRSAPAPGVHWVRSGLEDPDWGLIEELLGGEGFALVHLAAHGVDPKRGGWQDCFRFNVSHSLDFWLEAINRGAERIVTCGTCFEYGSAAGKHDLIPTSAAPEPLNAYAASKAAATMALHGVSSSLGIASLSLRPCVVYGEGEADYRLWPSLRRAARTGQDFPMTAGTQMRDFVPVEKVARELARGVGRSDLVPGHLLIENVGSGKGQSIIDFATEWWNRWEAKGKLLPGALEGRKLEAQRFLLLINDTAEGS